MQYRISNKAFNIYAVNSTYSIEYEVFIKYNLYINRKLNFLDLQIYIFILDFRYI